MDAVALASVITSGVVGLTGAGVAVGVAVWSARQNARLARETRTQQRLTDSYLEVLRIVEREGQWIEARVTNWTRAADVAELGPDPDPWDLPPGKRVTVPEPAVTDRAAIAAHLAAFGSEAVRGLYEAWRSTVKEIDAEDDMLEEAFQEAYPEGPGIDVLKRLRNELHPHERAAREALADAIAEEVSSVS